MMCIDEQYESISDAIMDANYENPKLACSNRHCDVFLDEYCVQTEVLPYAPNECFCSEECQTQWYEDIGWELEEEYNEK